MERFCSGSFGKILKLFPVCVIAAFLGKINVIEHCLDIETSASGKDGDMPSVINTRHGFFCHLLELHDMKFFGRFQHIDQMMGDAFHFFRSDLG